ncbi:hypothetical protein [Pseudarthrobacter oxydans]|uniref:hypothetical protein n=1 Tax=Pseudarthrobacter oxydans TaxID=1671 RepID=UPI002AA7CCC6|nr:hypothetical protein [Pseudarthrobacter oxydans]WPU08103.1 hypothetical protein SMD14_13110 [Pseudarthrobacter oxydans]
MHYFAKGVTLTARGGPVGDPPDEFKTITTAPELLALVREHTIANTNRTPAIELRCKGHGTGSFVYLMIAEAPFAESTVKAFYDVLAQPGDGDTFDDRPAVERPFVQWGSVTICCLRCGRTQSRSAVYGIRAAVEALTTGNGKLTCKWMT